MGEDTPLESAVASLAKVIVRPRRAGTATIAETFNRFNPTGSAAAPDMNHRRQILVRHSKCHVGAFLSLDLSMSNEGNPCALS